MENRAMNFLVNSNMKFGIGEFEKLPAYLEEMGFSNIAVIVDKAIAEIDYVKNVLSICKKSSKACEVLVYELNEEPTYDYLDECAERIRRNKDLSVIIGIGGGSAMDMAKGIAVLMTNKGPGVNYKGFPKGINRPVPVIAIPTTAGTGSETTYNAVFTDSKAGKKLGINTVLNFPVLSILDPKLIATCPQGVIASSGMDALTHAMESFVSKKATILTRMFSIEAIRLLLPNLEKVVDYPEDLDIKGNLQLGAFLAINGLINSSSGPAGALSYLLGTWYKVPHGTAGAVFLPHIHRFNFENGYYDYDILYNAINPDDCTCESRKEKAEFITDKIFFLNRKLGIKEKLSSYGVKNEDLIRFEQEALTTLKAAFGFNPIEMKKEDIRELLLRIA